MVRPQQQAGAKRPANTNNASVEQTHALGALLTELNYTPESAILWLKSNKYMHEGVHYNGAYVANYIAGARRVVTPAVTYNGVYTDLETQFRNGNLKFNKRQGFYNPKE